jgi:hypothetical protein
MQSLLEKADLALRPVRELRERAAELAFQARDVGAVPGALDENVSARLTF